MTVLQSINLDTEMTQASDVFLPGLVIPYAPTAAPPTGWLLCTGQAVSRTTYAALFAAIGTTYGSGDGSTTFNVPDMRGRFPAGADDMGTTRGAAGRIGTAMGASGGSQKKQLTSAHLPSHGHGIDSGAYVPSATPSTVGAHPHVYSLQHNMIPFGSAAILGFIHPQDDSQRPYDIQNWGYPNRRVSAGGDATSAGFNLTATGAFTPRSLTHDSGSHNHGNWSPSGRSYNTGGPVAVGTGAAFDTVPPYQAVNFIVKT
jgi:microcystin-dependent protein